MTEYQEQVKNNIMYPNVSRNRNPISGFNGIPSKGIASILKMVDQDCNFNLMI